MKKKKMIKILLVMGIIVCSCANVKAYSLEESEYSDLYTQWLELSDEERAQTLEPMKYDMIGKVEEQEVTNPLKGYMSTMSLSQSSYDLRDVISANMTVKNQQDTMFCWAFASTAALETTLAVKDLKKGAETKVYDYSERFMGYASFSTPYNNGQLNTYGSSTGGTLSGGTLTDSIRIYLNGLGAVYESSMPFVNTAENIDLSEIQNKEAQTTVKDIMILPGMTDEEAKTKMKEHVSLYGGLYVAIHGAGIFSDYYNNDTGALYVPDSSIAWIDHAVVLVGWDDNYSKTNFNEIAQPKNDGAWIVRNSWGEGSTMTYEESRQYLFAAYEEQFIAMGYNTANDVPEQTILALLELNGYTYSEDKDAYVRVLGDDGYMYVSYEDANVYSVVWGIEDASDEVEYDNVYSNDKVGPNYQLNYSKTAGDMTYLANTFTRTTSNVEKVKSVSIYTPQEYGDCKVYYTTNGSLDRDDFTEINLSDGNTTYLKCGYNTVEFSSPISINSTKFTIIIEIQSDVAIVALGVESKVADSIVEVAAGESFVSDETCLASDIWIDMGSEQSANLIMKANVVNSEDVYLSGINIKQEPTKTSYEEKENFDKTGMVVEAVYSDNTKQEITNYTVTNGTSLSLTQTSVTISYTENGVTKTTTQPIQVYYFETGEPPLQGVEEPELVDYTNAKLTITNINISGELENMDFDLALEISGLVFSDNGTEYEFLTYASQISGLENLQDDDMKKLDETSIVKQSDGTYTIKITLTGDDFEETTDAVDADKIYIYLKEYASLDGSIKYSIREIEVTEGSVGTEEEEEEKKEPEILDDDEKDTTVSTTVLPNTGNRIVMVSIIGVVISVVFVTYIRIKKMKDIK